MSQIKGGFFSQESHNKKYYFMAGIPRSGSTLLSSILNQNPRFYSGPSSPVFPLMLNIEQHLMNDELFSGFPKPQQGHLIISSVIQNYYSDVDNPIIIDKNRAWSERIEFINHYITSDVKIICPVRDIEEILTSFITMIRRNPYREGNPRINFIDEQLVKLNIPLTDDNRCEYIAGPSGILGQSLSSIVKAIESGFLNNLHFVEYNNLVNNPKETLENLYSFLDEEYYEHDFLNIKNNNQENDLSTYGIEDMHYVRPELKSTSKNPIDVLSDYVLERCRGMDVWRQLPHTYGVRGVSKYNKLNSEQIKIVIPDNNVENVNQD